MKQIGEKIQLLHVFLKKLEKNLSICTINDWNKVSVLEIKSQFKQEKKKITKATYSLLNGDTTADNIIFLLQSCYPNIFWKKWQFQSQIKAQYWDNLLNQRNFFLNLFEQLGLSVPEQWFSVKKTEISDNFDGWSFISQRYSGSIQQSLVKLYPEFSQFSQPWNFLQVPKGYWNSLQNQKYYLDYTGNSLGIKTLKDWYKIKDLARKIGPLYQRYNSIFEMFQTIYPNFFWVPWNFEKMGSKFWEKKKNQYFYIEDLSKKLKLKNIEDWYNISTKVFKKYNSTIYQEYSSLFELLNSIFPQNIWYGWKLEKIPKNYWKSKNNQKLIIFYIKKELKIKNFEDWYYISSTTFSKFGTIYFHYNSVYKMLKNIFPQYLWMPWKFLSAPKKTWEGKIGKYNRRQYFDQISHSLGVLNSSKDWYNISTEKILKNSILDNIYKSNLSYCIIDLYPEVYILPWKFQKIPSHFWNTRKNVSDFLFWFEKKFKIKDKSEWEFITNEDINKFGGNSLLRKFNGIQKMIKLNIIKK